MTALTDEQLMQRMQHGDVTALDELYDRHAAAALRVARGLCGDPELAADAVQEAFLAIWRSRDRYASGRGEFRAWAMTMVRNKVIDLGRKQKIRAQSPLDEQLVDRLADSADTYEKAQARLEARTVLDGLAELPAEQREAIVLSFFGGLSHGAIAQRLGLPAGTVKGRLRLGLEKLRGSSVPDLVGA